MVKNLPNNIIISASAKAAGIALNSLVTAWKDCENTAQIEQTKRENIKYWRDVNVKTIEENSAILKLHLEKSFQERAGTIQSTFDRLDQALAAGDTEIVSLMMGKIVDIVKESPLAQAQQVIADMHNPNVTMIEI